MSPLDRVGNDSLIKVGQLGCLMSLAAFGVLAERSFRMRLVLLSPPVEVVQETPDTEEVVINGD